jgi:hypothetical protein
VPLSDVDVIAERLGATSSAPMAREDGSQNDHARLDFADGSARFLKLYATERHAVRERDGCRVVPASLAPPLIDDGAVDGRRWATFEWEDLRPLGDLTPEIAVEIGQRVATLHMLPRPPRLPEPLRLIDLLDLRIELLRTPTLRARRSRNPCLPPRRSLGPEHRTRRRRRASHHRLRALRVGPR